MLISCSCGQAEKALDAMERKLAQSEEGNQILKSRVEALESDLSKVEHQWEEEKRFVARFSDKMTGYMLRLFPGKMKICNLALKKLPSIKQT